MDFNFKNIDELFVLALNVKFPNSFNCWETAISEDGVVLAHVVAAHGNLPDDFNDWDLVDQNVGMTVAHVAAMKGTLPKDVDPKVLMYVDIHNRTVQDILDCN